MTITDTRKKLYLQIIAGIILAAVSAAGSYAVLSASKKPAIPFQVVHSTKKPELAQQLSLPQKPVYGLPVRLVIPKIKVDANVLHLGVTKEGNMDVPPDLVNTSWYKYGPHPGEIGSAVIAGHLEGVKEAGVFINLGKLVVGDVVSVLDDRGVTTTFTVRETRLYGQNERPTEVFNDTSGAHLNLITCTGTWNSAQQRYSKRLVVFTDKSS